MTEKNCNKLILLGDNKVGKSNIFSKYIRNEFLSEYKSKTILDYGVKFIERNKKKIKLQLWDATGNPRFIHIIDSYYKEVRAAFIVYDISNKETFNNLDRWINEFKNLNNNAIIILIGNKSDLQNQREVTYDEGEQKARKYNIKFFEISALSGEGIDQAFDYLINVLTENYSNENEEEEEEEDEEVNIYNSGENIKIKCSLKKHKEIDAQSFCQECKIYMCNNCEQFHSQLFETHHQCKLDKNIDNSFIILCPEKNHYNKLNYFCKTHNQLCCTSCIANIKGHGNGKHKDCEICFIKSIIDEKKNGLEENIKSLEELSLNIDKTIDELKNIYSKIENNKERVKIKIQTMFTKIRNILNEREDELLLEIDKKYNELFFKEELITDNENLQNKIKISLEKGKIEEDEWEDKTKLPSLINKCIAIEDNIKNINIINENINKSKLNEIFEVKFNIEDEEINNILEYCNQIGKVYYNNEENKLIIDFFNNNENI